MAKIADVIKYEGDNSTFIWKHPSEDFNSLTQLIVHESQERGGNFTKSLAASFRPLISTAVKTNLTTCIKSQGINILEVDEHLAVLSDTMKKPIADGFDEYGLAIAEFYVTTVLLPEDDANFKRIRELHTISLQQRLIEAEAVIKSAQAEAAASVTVAQRQAIIEEKTTETEVARREAERDLIRAQTEAQKEKIAGMAEAEVMRAQGYNQKDVLQAEVQKAYAEGIGNMQISGSGGSAAGDMIGLGVGMAAAGAISGQMGNMFKGFTTPFADGNEANMNLAGEMQIASVICPSCKANIPKNSKFCPECGSKIELLAENEMICPRCGNKTHKGKFCMECGMPLTAKCPKCGNELAEGAKFCPECGEKLK